MTFRWKMIIVTGVIGNKYWHNEKWNQLKIEEYTHGCSRNIKPSFDCNIFIHITWYNIISFKVVPLAMHTLPYCNLLSCLLDNAHITPRDLTIVDRTFLTGVQLGRRVPCLGVKRVPLHAVKRNLKFHEVWTVQFSNVAVPVPSL